MGIYCVDYLNPAHFQGHPPDKLLQVLNNKSISIFQFMGRFSNIQLLWDMVRLEVTDSRLVPELAPYTTEDHPYLVLDSVNYDISDIPVLCAQSYINTDVIKYYLVRGRYSQEKEGP